MGSAVDILIFIGQALAIASIGYIVSQAFACTAKYRDPNTWKPAGFSARAPKTPAESRTENFAIQFSFVPEGLGGSRDDGANGIERAGSPTRKHQA
jgi:hypothetical protein